MPNEHKPLESLSYAKSNELISAKYKSNLLENQLVAIALSRIEVNIKDETSPLKARLYPGELKRIIGDPSHIYTRLKRVSKSMTGHSILLEDGLGNFKAFAIVTNANYIDGILEITLNNEIRPHILNLEKRYTVLELSVMAGFKKDASFRIYEIFKSLIYKSNSKINEGRVDVEYNLSELRFMIGLANVDDNSIKSLRIKMGSNVDWDELYERLDDRAKVYKRWSEFERNVLKPAQKELEETADIRFEYTPIRLGRSMSKILFYLYPNTPANQTVINEKQAYLNRKTQNNRQNELPRDLPQFEYIYTKYIDHNGLTAEDIDTLLKKANLNDKLVQNAIELADKQPEIANYVGWIVRCIENGGYEQKGTITGSTDKYDTFKEIRENIQVNKNEIAKKVWARMKTSEEFDDFLDYIKRLGMDSIEILEAAYTAEELTKMFTDYKTGKKVIF